MIGHREIICTKSLESVLFFLLLFVFVFFNLGFTARQDYFTHFEQSKREILRKKHTHTHTKKKKKKKKTPDHPQAELGLSYMCLEPSSNPQRWDDRAITSTIY